LFCSGNVAAGVYASSSVTPDPNTSTTTTSTQINDMLSSMRPECNQDDGDDDAEEVTPAFT
jgi:hypothetical protein